MRSKNATETLARDKSSDAHEFEEVKNMQLGPERKQVPKCAVCVPLKPSRHRVYEIESQPKMHNRKCIGTAKAAMARWHLVW